MCREQLPVWQELHETYGGDNAAIVAVAMNAQGSEKARPFMEKAKGTFTCLIDEDNVLGKTLGFKAIPNGVLVDEEGRVAYQRFGGFEVRKPEIRKLVEDWLRTSSVTGEEATEATPLDQQVMELFNRGLELYRQGSVGEAMALWHSAVELDPRNFIIRKQMWAVEHPERFYDGDVDFDWQREQMRQGL